MRIDAQDPVLELELTLKLSQPLTQLQIREFHGWLEYLIYRNMTEYSCKFIMYPNSAHEFPIYKP